MPGADFNAPTLPVEAVPLAAGALLAVAAGAVVFGCAGLDAAVDVDDDAVDVDAGAFTGAEAVLSVRFGG